MFYSIIDFVLIIFAIAWSYIFGFNLKRYIELLRAKKRLDVDTYKYRRNECLFGLFSSLTLVVANFILAYK